MSLRDESHSDLSAIFCLHAREKSLCVSFKLHESKQYDNISDQETKSGKTVEFYSLEMESSEIYERLLSKRSKIPMNTLIERGVCADNLRFEKDKIIGFSARDLKFLQKKINELSALPIKINDNPACTVNDIHLKSRRVAAQANSRTKPCKERSLNSRDGEPPLGLIVIDYLQLMRSTKRAENRNLEVGAICRELWCLASELGVSILFLSQLNRTSNESTRPSPSELRDSGSIEQDANKVILMWCKRVKCAGNSCEAIVVRFLKWDLRQ